MSRILSIVVVMLVAVSLNARTVLAAPPTTQPSLEQQNADLRELVNDYSQQLDRANSKLKFEEQRNITLKSQMAALVREFTTAQRALQTPQPAPSPYRQLQPSASPSVSPYIPDSTSLLGSFIYNDKTVYLVGPLVAKRITMNASTPQTGHPDHFEVQVTAPAK